MTLLLSCPDLECTSLSYFPTTKASFLSSPDLRLRKESCPSPVFQEVFDYCVQCVLCLTYPRSRKGGLVWVFFPSFLQVFKNTSVELHSNTIILNSSQCHTKIKYKIRNVEIFILRDVLSLLYMLLHIVDTLKNPYIPCQ